MISSVAPVAPKLQAIFFFVLALKDSNKLIISPRMNSKSEKNITNIK